MRSLTGRLTSVFILAQAGLIAGCNLAGSLGADLGTTIDVRIESQPTGATVYLMGAKAGVTPMVIKDRDIYPVSYAPANEKYYGKVLLRKKGCRDFSKRLTRADVNRGLVAHLDCGADITTRPAIQTPLHAPQPAAAPPPTDAPTTAVTPVSEPTLPERQLQQLRSLQRLLEEGVITRDEEETLRKRILNDS